MREYVTALIGVAGVLSGTVLGWFLSKSQVKLSFGIGVNPDYEDTKSTGTQSGREVSRYQITCFNTGDKPFMLYSLSVIYQYKKIELTLFNPESAINPYQMYSFVLSKSEYEKLDSFICNIKLNKLKAIAYDVSGKKHYTTIQIYVYKLASVFGEK